MSDPDTLPSDARTSTPNRVGEITDEFIGKQTQDSSLDEELRLKMRYNFVLGKLDANPSNRPKWEEKRHEIEQNLMANDIRPSTLLD